jgi:mannose-6-phosphate isomerase
MGATARPELPPWALSAIPLPPNRVPRFYRGGASIETFRGVTEPHDGDRPEDWVGSVTPAWVPPGTAPSGDGLSPLEGGGRLRDLLDEAPEALAGAGVVAAAGATTALLVKLLDAAIRLPVHCHPTRPFAQRVLGSPFGKTEAWIILGTRQVPGEEPPHVRLGFRRDVPAAELRSWIADQRSTELLEAMHRRPLVVGETWLVPAGMPHAIGAGVFLVELQEPTDFSIVAETAGYPIDPADASLHKGWDVMLDSFDRRGYSDAEIDALRTAETPGSGTTTSPYVAPLLTAAADPFFRAFRLRLPPTTRAAWPCRDAFGVAVVIGGAGELRTPGARTLLRAGDTVAVPAAAAGATAVISSDGLELIACLAPDAAALAADVAPGPTPSPT